MKIIVTDANMISDSQVRAEKQENKKGLIIWKERSF